MYITIKYLEATMKINIKIGFTLAEILITLGIIGVVATMTIPRILANIKNKIEEHKIQVFEKKMTESLNLLNSQENGLSAKYNTSEDFVKALSKYLKIVKICSKTELNQCFPYDIVTIERNGKTTHINTNDLSTAHSLHLTANGFEDTAGLIMGDGTTVILSYNKNCISDSGRNYQNISECVAGIYDINGPQRPNKFGVVVDSKGKVSSSADIKSFNGASLSDCILSLGSVCITSVHKPTTVYSTHNCEQLKANNMYGITICPPDYSNVNSRDSWLNTMVYCGENGGHLANLQEMDNILILLYGVQSAGDHNNHEVISGNINKQIASALGINYGGDRIWSSYSYGTGDAAYSVIIRENNFEWYYVNRNMQGAGLCIEN